MISFPIIILGLCVILTITLVVVHALFDRADGGDILAGLFGGIVGVGSLLFVVLMFASLLGEKHKVGEESIPIISLKVKDNVSGSFFLGCGSIGSTEYYVFYSKKDNGYIRTKVETDEDIIVESKESPVYKADIYSIDNKFWYPFEFTRKRNERLVVPVGTIVQKFNLE